VPAPQVVRDTGGFVDFSYVNHVLVNGAVIACAFDDPHDETAAAILREAYPGREVVSVDARPLFERGGGIHCITPAAARCQYLARGWRYDLVSRTARARRPAAHAEPVGRRLGPHSSPRSVPRVGTTSSGFAATSPADMSVTREEALIHAAAIAAAVDVPVSADSRTGSPTIRTVSRRR